VIKTVPEMMFIIIAIFSIIALILIAQHTRPSYCSTDMNTTSSAVMSNLKKCIDICWKKHDFGSDPTLEDCYLITLSTTDFPIKKSQLDILENVKVNWDYDLVPSQEYKILVRYSYSAQKIELFDNSLFNP